jgi:hypothetical protein
MTINILKKIPGPENPKEVYEWGGMPEFKQAAQEPFMELKIRFRNWQDYQEFAALMNQKLTLKTKSLWYPELVRGLDSEKRYVEENSL